MTFPSQTNFRLMFLREITIVYSEKHMQLMVRDGSVGIATPYGMEGPVTEYW
jgi:hypothetical protein